MPRKPLAEIRDEMSIAGDPEKMMNIFYKMRLLMRETNRKNAAELINIEFICEELLNISRSWKRAYTKRTRQQIGK